MVNDLMLLSGVEIPFLKAKISIHQPTIKEISYIGEDAFFIGCELLKFSKDKLTEEDKSGLNDLTNFDIIMSILKEKKDLDIQKSALYAQMVLMLMFPDCQLQVRKDHIALMRQNEQDNQKIDEFYINNSNYEDLKEILIKMFAFEDELKDDYNPLGDMAKRIADKFKKSKAKKAELSGEGNKKISVFTRYISILSVGEQKDINTLMNYTVYQLKNEFKRFQMKEAYDTYVKAALAGATELKEPKHWMADINSDDRRDSL